MIIQIPLYTDDGNLARYLELIKKSAFKLWPNPCPLCGADDCAKFLQFYVRVRIYFGDMVYQNVKIARFLCHRKSPDVPAGTHRTFSLLPCCLIPYSPYALDVTLDMAQTLAEQNKNAYKASHLLASTEENLSPEPITLRRIERRLNETIQKLEHYPLVLQQRLADRELNAIGFSDVIALANAYRSQLLTSAFGAAALCYDWFYLYQKNLPYMQRDFFLGTPSHKRFRC
jgi:hypothetical protein